MTGKLLVDTSVIVGVFGGNAAAQRVVADAEEVFVPSIALGELFYGAERSSRRDAEMARVEEFASACSILACDMDTARHYARLKNALRAKGRPIPENDIWIGALGAQHGLTIAARDAHFKELDGVSLLAW